MTVNQTTTFRLGVHPDMPADVYHADPVPDGSLSSSEARALLPPSCPALYKHRQDNTQPHRRVFDVGHAAHRLVLGVGDPIEVIDAADWRTKAAKEQRDTAHAAGRIPLLVDDHDTVQAMATALREHPVASALLHPQGGRAEQSLFWTDPATQVTRRARLDWMPTPQPGRRYILPDYKTCHSAAPDRLQRAFVDFGYHQQAAWYLDAVRALLPLGGIDPVFLFICQEKTPPYLVTVVQPDPNAVRIGAHLNREALTLYAECQTSGRWPGYSDEPVLLSLPAWIEKQYDKETW